VKTKTKSAGLILAILLATPAAAETVHKTPVDSFHRWTDKELLGLTVGDKSAVLSDHETFWIETLSRGKNGEVELHDHWNDNIVVQQGEATLTYGGKMTGGREIEPGNWRGMAITGGESMTLHAGDVVVIPSGLPHLFSVEKGKSIRYLVFKSRQ